MFKKIMINYLCDSTTVVHGYTWERVRVVKADIIAIMIHSNLSNIFLVSHVLRAKVIEARFRDPEKVSLSPE